MPSKNKNKALATLDSPEGTADPSPVVSTNDKSSPLTEKEKKTLIAQIQSEYKIAETYIKPRWDEWVLRLKLYNNQRRDKDAIGDPTMFTIHQTILASLYQDELQVEFNGREEGDSEVAENLNDLAKFDYDEMEKSQIDYFWDWDATFFGRGLVLLWEFDKDTKTPIPEVIDPLTFLRDPRATSVNGDLRRRGACRFMGRLVRLAKYEMPEEQGFIDTNKISDMGGTSQVKQNAQLRREGQGLNSTSNLKYEGANEDFEITEWYTHWEDEQKKVHKVRVSLANQRQLIVRFQIIGPAKRNWPIIDRVLYPMSGSFDGVSVPDMTEDKQRARAKINNLSLHSVELGQYPRRLYNENKISNKADLQNASFDQWIPVKGDPSGTVSPLEAAQVKNEVSFILNELDAAAQKAMATPDIQQGVQSDSKRTATEISIQQSKVDTRYGLSLKIFGWSEKEYWRQWYTRYKEILENKIDKKMIRISGSYGSEYRPLTKENIISDTDPDVTIVSKALSDAKRLTELNVRANFFAQIMVDPTVNKRFVQKEQARLVGYTKREIDAIFPLTADEWQAKLENKELDKDKMVSVGANDNHLAHIEIHKQAADNSAKELHIQAHVDMLMIQKQKPEVFAPPAADGSQPMPGGVLPGQGLNPNPVPQGEAPAQLSLSPQ